MYHNVQRSSRGMVDYDQGLDLVFLDVEPWSLVTVF